jgi:DNA-binding NarL/FixJ family response regulator
MFGNSVVDRTTPLKLILVEPDSLMRLGIQRYLQRHTDWQVVAGSSDMAQVGWLLSAQIEAAGLPDLLILGGALNGAMGSLAMARQLKQDYPYLRLLLLSAIDDPGLADAWWGGIEGCCWRESVETELVVAIAQVAAGQTYWSDRTKAAALGQTPPEARLVVAAGWKPAWLKIDLALQQLAQELRSPRASILERWVMEGRQRELLAARWLVQQVLPGGKPPERILPPSTPPPPEPESGRLAPITDLFDRITDKLRYSLENQSETPLEIDILRLDKKRELFYLVLRKFEACVDELRHSQVNATQLADQRIPVLQDLWQAVLSDFLGKYYTVDWRGESIAVVPALLEQSDIVTDEILAKIPFVEALFRYLLDQSPLQIDNVAMPANSPQAIVQAGMILENLAIQVANAVMQPLLNRFSDVEQIKQTFYDRRKLSTREIERFRNDLSWRYRVERFVGEPTAIFASQYWLLILTPEGIVRQSIYAPRRQELDSLAGVPLLVTLLLETRDAMSPRLKRATAWVGSGLVYVLTEVVGRGIGLVGRGIIKGIGNALQDRR